MHDPLSVSDLVQDELRQRIETGYDVSGIEAELAALLPMIVIGWRRCIRS